jgi:hypothetical protein
MRVEKATRKHGRMAFRMNCRRSSRVPFTLCWFANITMERPRRSKKPHAAVPFALPRVAIGAVVGALERVLNALTATHPQGAFLKPDPPLAELESGSPPSGQCHLRQAGKRPRPEVVAGALSSPFRESREDSGRPLLTRVSGERKAPTGDDVPVCSG